MHSLAYFILAFLPRALYLTAHQLTHPRDELKLGFHWPLATRLLQNRGLSLDGEKVTFEPLYAFFLAAARWITRDHFILVLILQVMICAVAAVFLHKLAWVLTHNRTIAWYTVLAYSVYPYFIRQSIVVGEVSLLTTLLIIATYYYCQSSRKPSRGRDALACGISFGLAILTRPSVLPVWMMGFMALFIKRCFRSAALIFFAAFLLLLPFLIHNHAIDGSFFPARSGIELWKGNCEYSDRLLPAYNLDLVKTYLYTVREKERPELSEYGMNESGRYFTQKAFAFMKEHPVRTLKLKLRNIFYLFYPRLIPFYPLGEKTEFVFDSNGGFQIHHLPRREIWTELAYTIPYGFLFLTGLAGLILRRKEIGGDLILLLTGISFCIVYSVYFPTTRYRAPMDFVLMFYSACFMARLMPRHFQSRL